MVSKRMEWILIDDLVVVEPQDDEVRFLSFASDDASNRDSKCTFSFRFDLDVKGSMQCA